MQNISTGPPCFFIYYQNNFAYYQSNFAVIVAVPCSSQRAGSLRALYLLPVGTRSLFVLICTVFIEALTGNVGRQILLLDIAVRVVVGILITLVAIGRAHVARYLESLSGRIHRLCALVCHVGAVRLRRRRERYDRI